MEEEAKKCVIKIDAAKTNKAGRDNINNLNVDRIQYKSVFDYTCFSPGGWSRFFCTLVISQEIHPFTIEKYES